MDTTPTVTTTERGLLMLMLMPRLFTDTSILQGNVVPTVKENIMVKFIFKVFFWFFLGFL